MKAGRELDALIAKDVMEWHDVFLKPQIVDNGCWYAGNMFVCKKKDFKPSTDIAAAWEVLEHLKDKWQSITLTRDWDSGKWVCRLGGWGMEPSVVEAVEQKLPHAICIAALKTVKK